MWGEKQAGSRLSRWCSESSSQFLFTIYRLVMPVPSTPLDKAPSHFILSHGIHLTSWQRAMSMQTPALLPPPYSNIEGHSASLLLEKQSWKEGSRLCHNQALPRTLSPYFALVTSLGLPWLYMFLQLCQAFLSKKGTRFPAILSGFLGTSPPHPPCIW